MEMKNLNIIYSKCEKDTNILLITLNIELFSKLNNLDISCQNTIHNDFLNFFLKKYLSEMRKIARHDKYRSIVKVNEIESHK